MTTIEQTDRFIALVGEIGVAGVADLLVTAISIEVEHAHERHRADEEDAWSEARARAESLVEQIHKIEVGP